MKRSMQCGVLLMGGVICMQANATEFSGFAAAGATVSPIYSGSDHFAPGPLLKAGVTARSQNWGAVSLSTEGLSWNFMPESRFSTSLLLTRDEGRKDTFNYPLSGKKNHSLNGMGDLPATVMAGTELRYQNDDWAVWLQILGTNKKCDYGSETLGAAMVVNSGVEAVILRRHSTVLSLGSDISWANRAQMQKHYGVTTSQANHTRFDQYAPSAGWQTGGLYADLIWELTNSLSAGVNGRVGYLFDEAGKSPLVNSRAQYTLSSFILYSF